MSFRRLQWLFPIAVSLHNLEEAIAYPDFVSLHSKDLKWTIEPSTFGFAVLVLTVAAWIVTYYSWREGSQSLAAYLVFGYAAAMLLNVAVPHVPLAAWFAGYTPGLLTAVTLNLPCMSFLLVRALGEDYVTGKKAAAVSGAVIGGIAALILLLSLTPR